MHYIVNDNRPAPFRFSSLQEAVNYTLNTELNTPYFDTLNANQRHAAALEWIERVDG